MTSRRSPNVLPPAWSDTSSGPSNGRGGDPGSDTNRIDIGSQGVFRNRSTSISVSESYNSLSRQTPARSYVQRSFFHPSSGHADISHDSTRDVREETASLASRAFNDGSLHTVSPRARLESTLYRAVSESGRPVGRQSVDGLHHEASQEFHIDTTIDETPDHSLLVGPSQAVEVSIGSRDRVLTDGMERAPPVANTDMASIGDMDDQFSSATIHPGIISQPHEQTPLLRQHTNGGGNRQRYFTDLEDLRTGHGGVEVRIGSWLSQMRLRAQYVAHTVLHPKLWDKGVIVQAGLAPVRAIPAVILGLLLNVLDALSYGMILFPLGTPLFQGLGSDGISMFYISCIISQLVYSCGGSIFRGGVGSQMIEVVPFFHSMAFAIVNEVGEDKPHEVLATTILAYSVSSIVTGLAFFILGSLNLGSLIGFFPRHILVGCIGGVGFFLIVTGIEVSSRMGDSFAYTFETLEKLFGANTVALWTIPLALAILLFASKRWIKHAYADAGFFILIILVFYIVVLAVPQLSIEDLRERGWIFEAPDAGQPWWHFYSLYDFRAVDWGALASTIPAMLALTFFGLLHVPINVPALALSTGEDNLNLDRELRAHGYSNALSGLCGSIQNYLVYTNTLLFIRGGGNSRLAGVILALATVGILFVGPVIIGYVPIMVVGALIFYLGIDLLREAVYDTWGKAGRSEYFTIVVIVLVMGIYDFVVGIGVGILVACISFVLQTSHVSAVRGTIHGGVANSTVRRHPIQQHYLHEVGTQTYVMRLAGFLFFGTIVGVENEIRKVLDDDQFSNRPILFLVLDISKVDGVDFSAAEAFTRINRILRRKNVRMIMCGLSLDTSLGRNLINLGVLDEEEQILCFDALNPALEFCENEMLKTFYQRRDWLLSYHSEQTSHSDFLEIPKSEPSQPGFFTASNYGSPRRGQLDRAAAEALLEQQDLPTQKKWERYKQPLQLILQTFSLLSARTEEFWQRLVPFLTREEWSAGAVLYQSNGNADSFYLLQTGILKAQYDLPQGNFSEVIVAGTTCGELPFFSSTKRTSTTVAERDSVTWALQCDAWQQLQKDEPEVAMEILKVSLRLTSERMDAITKYMLVTG